jgi:acyl carrier protein
MSAVESERIRQVLRDHALLPVDVDSIDDEADLFQAGMSSHASVNVMLALEDSFDIEFPDSMLTRSVFGSIAAIGAAVQELRAQAA